MNSAFFAANILNDLSERGQLPDEAKAMGCITAVTITIGKVLK
ncbi:hypothetical protein [Mucilaginibacter conchicola]|nr:hypothetical protein [Mucilaginibacter conchicola]